jgi:hypothetical protein
LRQKLRTPSAPYRRDTVVSILHCDERERRIMLQEYASTMASIQDLTNAALLDEARRLAQEQRGAIVRLITAIAEVDARRLYLSEGYSSMFAYCTRELRLSEHAAYLRIEVGRLSRRFPVVLDHLADGSLTLTNICLLAPRLTTENCAELIAQAMHATKREVEELLATLFPVSAEPRPHRLFVHALSEDCFRVEFTVTRETLNKLRLAQDVLSHSVPDGDPAAVLDKALTLLLAVTGKRKVATALDPEAADVGPPRSRMIPAAVKRAVWKRDGGRCAFIGTQGRCGETRWLEFHHVQPFAAGGETSVPNLQLRCRAHNAYEAERSFSADRRETGAETATKAVETRSRPSSPGPSQALTDVSAG